MVLVISELFITRFTHTNFLLQLQLELSSTKEQLCEAQESLAQKDEALSAASSGEVGDLKKKLAELEEECKKLASRNEELELHVERSALKVSYYSCNCGSELNKWFTFPD